MPTYQANVWKRLAVEIFVGCGVPKGEAEIVAENLVETSLMGLDSHGLLRIPQYVNAILDSKADGAIRPGGAITIEKEKGSTAIVDCGRNFGQVGGLRAMELAIKKAKEYGISCVVTKNCNHAGRLGAFTQIAAQAGMVALATCNSPKHGHWVAPFGGREGRLATNPFSFAAPRNGDPIILDMSSSAVNEGKVRICLNAGHEVASDCIADVDGAPTTDPKKFYGPPKGTIKPFGGPAGYKGTGLGMMVEILSGTLKGDFVKDETIIGNGLCFIVINIGNFVSPDRFRELCEELTAYIKSSQPAQGSKGVSVPGEIDFQTRKKRLKDGISVDNHFWKQIQKIAARLNVTIDVS